jgi:hypothetical protein
MNVIPPLSITDAMLISSTASEPAAGSPSTESIYYAGTTYGLGDIVISTTTHRKYESLAAGNVGNALTDTTKWLDVGATNKWSMFDLYRNTATVLASPLTVTIAPGQRVDSIALLGVVADSATITVDSAIGSPSERYYTHTENMITREVLSWYDFFFNEFVVKSSLVLFDLAPYATAYITISLTRAAGNAECGACVLGKYVYIGDVEHGAVSDVINFSTITREFDGSVSVLVPRQNIPKINETLYIEKAQVNKVRAVRDALAGIPAVWCSLDELSTHDYFEMLLILGPYRQFSINAELPDMAIITLEAEEI